MKGNRKYEKPDINYQNFYIKIGKFIIYLKMLYRWANSIESWGIWFSKRLYFKMFKGKSK